MQTQPNNFPVQTTTSINSTDVEFINAAGVGLCRVVWQCASCWSSYGYQAQTAAPQLVFTLSGPNARAAQIQYTVSVPYIFIGEQYSISGSVPDSISAGSADSAVYRGLPYPQIKVTLTVAIQDDEFNPSSPDNPQGLIAQVVGSVPGNTVNDTTYYDTSTVGFTLEFTASTYVFILRQARSQTALNVASQIFSWSGFLLAAANFLHLLSHLKHRQHVRTVAFSVLGCLKHACACSCCRSSSLSECIGGQ